MQSPGWRLARIEEQEGNPPRPTSTISQGARSGENTPEHTCGLKIPGAQSPSGRSRARIIAPGTRYSAAPHRSPGLRTASRRSHKAQATHLCRAFRYGATKRVSLSRASHRPGAGRIVARLIGADLAALRSCGYDLAESKPCAAPKPAMPISRGESRYRRKSCFRSMATGIRNSFPPPRRSAESRPTARIARTIVGVLEDEIAWPPASGHG